MIYVDTREPKVKIAKRIDRLGHDFRVEKQEHKADFVIDQGMRKIGIQRKRIDDFINSLDKLKTDMDEGRHHYEVFCLLIEGMDDPRIPGLYKRTGGRIGIFEGCQLKTRESLQTLHNFCFSQGMRGSPILFTHDLDETCRMLCDIHNYSGPVIETEGQSSQLGILLQLPGIGEGRAEDILEEYGSVLDALSHIESWSDDVPGVGDATVDKCLQVLG